MSNNPPWTLPAPFEALRPFQQWIVYQLHSPDAAGKYQKRPVDHRTGKVPLKGHGGPEIWTDFATAANAAAKPLHGVGFHFAAADPFWFLDIDNCLEADNKTWSPLAMSLLEKFPGAAVEVSSSGRALHIIGSGTAPAHACKSVKDGIEFYTQDRWVALTGISAMGNAGTDHTGAVAALVAQYFPSSASETSADWTDEALWPVPGTADDTTLIAKARQSKPAAAVFGDALTFEELWTAEGDALGKHFAPHQHGQAYDPSSADQALANRLIWWTGGDCERTKILMQQSELARSKWDRDDYLDGTILSALDRVAKNPPKDMSATVVPTGTTTTAAASQYKIVTAAEYSASRAHMQWAIKNVIQAEGVGVVYAPYRAGKSFLVLDMAGAMAAGHPKWFGYTVKGARPVLYIALEGQAGVKQRLDAYAKKRGGMPEQLYVIDSPLDLRIAANVDGLIQAIRASGWKGPGVIFVDTLSAATPGGDENGSEGMGAAIAGLRRIQAAVGGMVIAVHHTGKDPALGMRGHSSLGGTADVTVVIEREPGAAMRTWKSDKQKDGPESEGVPFTLEIVQLGTDEDGDPITSCVVKPGNVTSAAGVPLPPRTVRPKLQSRQRRALKEVQTQINKSELKTDDGKPCVSLLVAEIEVAKVLPYARAAAKDRGARQAVAALIDNGYLGYANDAVWVIFNGEESPE